MTFCLLGSYQHARASVVLVLGMQNTSQQGGSKAEEAKDFLNDAHAQMDGVEQELDKMLKNMGKLTTWLQATSPIHQVSSKPQSCNPMSLLPTLIARVQKRIWFGRM